MKRGKYAREAAFHKLSPDQTVGSRQKGNDPKATSSNLKGNRRKAAQKATTVAKEAGRQDPTPILNAGDSIIPKDTGNSYCFPATAIPTALIPRGPRSVWKVTVIPSVIPAGAAEIWKKYFSPEAASLIKP